MEDDLVSSADRRDEKHAEQIVGQLGSLGGWPAGTGRHLGWQAAGIEVPPGSHGVRRYWKSHYLWDLPDAAIDAFLGRAAASADGGAPVTGSLQTRRRRHPTHQHPPVRRPDS